jgi:hypothetical protein
MLEPLFVSHSSEDRQLLGVLSDFLKDLSSTAIQPWFSSDPRSSGGLDAGDDFYEKILEKIKSSHAVLALVTRNSVASHWPLFESGYGHACGKAIITVAHGIRSSEIPSPLKKWQVYRIDNRAQIQDFCVKLFKMYGFDLHNTTYQAHAQTYVEPIINIKSSLSNEEKAREELNQQITAELKSALKLRQQDAYEIKMDSDFGGASWPEVITEGTSVGDVLENIYQRIQDHVPPASYLDKWMVVSKSKKIKVIVKEITDLIPANAIFKAGISWRVIKLPRPYQVSDSRFEIFAEFK